MITIIPAIDLIDGKCVRLSQGDYSRKTIYSDSPVDMAKSFEDAGIQRLHLVDLDGAKSGKVVNLSVLEKIAAATKLEIDFGGGIKSDEDIRSVFDAGAEYASLGSVAVKNPELLDKWIQEYSSDKIFLGADVKNEKIAVSGWLEETEENVFDFVKRMMTKRLSHIFCTDIGSDGMLNGPAAELYRHLLAQNPGLRLVASGGVSSMQDIEALDQLGCDGVIVGKAFYEGKISLAQLASYSRQKQN